MTTKYDEPDCVLDARGNPTQLFRCEECGKVYARDEMVFARGRTLVVPPCWSPPLGPGFYWCKDRSAKAPAQSATDSRGAIPGVAVYDLAPDRRSP